jgi:DNA primase
MIYRYLKYQVHQKDLHEYQVRVKRFLDFLEHNESQTEYRIYKVKSRENTFVHMIAFKSELQESKHRQADYSIEFSEYLDSISTGLPEFGELIPIEGE